MINSRDPKELTSQAQALWHQLHDECAKVGIDLILTSTYRDVESQNDLYAIGRTKPGKIVTNARGGESFHNYRIAFDVVPVVNGKASWNDLSLWKRVSGIGKKLGLVSGADFSIRDYPHFQLAGYRIQNGKLSQ